MTKSKAIQEALRNLPAIDEVILSIESNKFDLPYLLIKDIAQNIIDNLRIEIINNNIPDNILKTVKNEILLELNKIIDLSIKPIINGTGIVLHTGFGRAPISRSIIDKANYNLSSYCSLEFNVQNGIRGERLQYSKILINALINSEDSLVVNNCAAAVFIALNTIAFDKEVLISRGQQVEIGGSFRIPEVIKKSGCKMIEVGTTNRTHLKDYKNAITKNTGAILIVHPSNYKVIGFTKDADIIKLIALSKEKNIPIVLDLGSGMLLNKKNKFISNDPVIKKYFEMGIDIVTFSADKLLGGPQAGIIAGNKNLIDIIHKNPLYRSLRCNKFILSILEQTLSQYKTDDDVFKNNLALSLLNQSRKDLLIKGKKIITKINKKILNAYAIELVDSEVEVGSGSLPTEKKTSVAIKFLNKEVSSTKISKLFRKNTPPIIGYINNKVFYIDVKAILNDDLKMLSGTINNILK